MKHLRQAFQLLIHLGPAWVAFRLRYALRKKSGALTRRVPIGNWAKDGAAKVAGHEPALFRARVEVGDGCVTEAEAVLVGSMRYFSRHQKETGFPPPWHLNPFTGQIAPAEVHWSRIGDFCSGDIKGVWEISRFPWAWPLARAYVRTGDERFAEGFWGLFENWLVCNSPNQGANWMCGQEATFRLMAATFARQVLAKSRATTPARVARMQEFVRVSARRIAANLDYGLSQSNNHGVSECIGLITAAVILPDLAESASWLAMGMSALESQLDALVYADGAFSQHSATYHRVLLHDLLWGAALLRGAGQKVPLWWVEAAKRALGFIDALITPTTGRVPLYGANDGANILPLADADYLDFRPLVQAGFAVLHGVRRFEPGPWDEAAQWLAGTETLKTESREPRAIRWHAPDGGCLVLRNEETRLFLRCPEVFRHRPSHADMLHVDLEWRDQPIAIDGGTYSYNTPGAFARGLKEAQYHNTLTLDGAEPLEKVGRFLYLPWPRGRVEWSKPSDEFVAIHDGWSRLSLSHERRVAQPLTNVVMVTDFVRGVGRHRGRLHWLFADLPYRFEPENNRLTLATPAGDYVITWVVAGGAATVVRADPDTARGWWSPYYQDAAPALSLAIEFNFENESKISTTLAPV